MGGIGLSGFLLAAALGPQPADRTSLHRTVDLNVGETQEVTLADGTRVPVKLLDLEETRDGLCSAVWRARVKVSVGGTEGWVASGFYNLPVRLGPVQIDCPVTRGVYTNTATDFWALQKHARLRLWPADSPLVEPGTFVYPLKQRWFAADTWFANEPVLVNVPKDGIYYHSGLDIGGCEGMAEVISATDGRVLVAGKETAGDVPDLPIKQTYRLDRYSDTVWVLDDRGWVHWYVHLKTIDVRAGQQLKKGDRIGLLGKEGGSGGWSHLHYEVWSRLPSGRWSTENGYPFIWEAYVREHAPGVLAVAGPIHHRLAVVGENVELDGSGSRAFGGEPPRLEWRLSDGRAVAGTAAARRYERPGTYVETLKAADARGGVAYDFVYVEVVDRHKPQELPPRLHAAYAPTFAIRPGDPVTFKVRTWNTTEGEETWDFGDGTPPVSVKSAEGYAETVHAYARPGHYLVRVERVNGAGIRGSAYLHVSVEK